MNQNDPISKNRASGSGSAHLRFAMFGARGPLFAPEGDGTSSAATNATTTATAAAGDPNATAATPPPAANTPKVFTQEEVNRIAATARDEGRRSVAAAAAPKPNTSSTTSSSATVTATAAAATPVTIESVAAQLENERLRREFAEYAADHGVPRTQREDMFELYRAQRPGDPEAWFQQKRERGLFGSQQQAAGNTATTATSAAPNTNAANMATPGAAQQTSPTDPARPPAAAPSAPANAALPMQQGMIDIFACTPAQLQQLGPQGVRDVLDKLASIGAQMQGAPQRPKVPSRQ
jgi:hypothetical protein